MLGKSPKPFDFAGVGLGIVAALEKPASKALFARDLTRRPANTGRNAEDVVEYADEPFRIKSNRGGVFHIALPKIREAAGVPPPDFLSACNLCRKGLDGADIYMYRGEKGFCSPECRYRGMAVDESAEKCSSEAVSAGSPNYANGQILTNGILAI